MPPVELVKASTRDSTATPHRDQTVLAPNYNCSNSANAFAIASTATAVGAFLLINGSKDTAILTPVSCTAVVSGVGARTDTALVVF